MLTIDKFQLKFRRQSVSQMLSTQGNPVNGDNGTDDKVESEEREVSSHKNTFERVAELLVPSIVAAILLALYMIPTIYFVLPPKSLYKVSVIYCLCFIIAGKENLFFLQ